MMLCVLCAVLAQDVMSRQALHQSILAVTESEQRTYSWSDASLDQLWSAVVQSDNLVTVGYRTPAFGHRKDLASQNLDDSSWTAVRKRLVTDVLSMSRVLCNSAIVRSDIVYKGTHDRLPYVVLSICHPDLLETLRASNHVRYLEPYSYTTHVDQQRSGEGCSSYSQVLSAGDYTSISPAAISSWHQSDHQIDSAWLKSSNGKDIWIAIMDTGISDDNPKYNGDFDEGESVGRILEKKGFYNMDGWVDQCGHGTAMIGLAAAPRGYDDSPAGVAYRANLISYRVSNDVVINAGDEIDALADAITDAADDSRVHIISMSLGDLFSHGPIEDAIVYAHEAEKLILAAAGTSTFITNGFGVVFPADMDETIAVTGVVEGSDFDECDNCHYGSEVDLVVYMERSSGGNTCITTADDNGMSDYVGYVGGSSAATATMAGIAALIWSDVPVMTRDEIINRLIKSSSDYPDKTEDFGWGAIDVCAAVFDSLEALPCKSHLPNDVILEITSITFPSTSDGFLDNTAEWAIILEDSSYYFEVPIDGGQGNSITYNNGEVCQLAPIRMQLGSTICGQTQISLDLETHEDDGLFSECDFNSGDDDRTQTVVTVDFGNNQFTQSTSNGTFTFTYRLYCTPAWTAELVDDSPKCPGDSVTFIGSPPAQGTYKYYLDADKDGQLVAGELLQSSTIETYRTTAINDGDHIGLVIDAGGGCTDTLIRVITMKSPNYAGAQRLTGTLSGYHDYETNGHIESVQILDGTSVVDYDAGLSISLFEGFEVQSGAVFEAFIDGCNDGGGGTQLQVGEKYD